MINKNLYEFVLNFINKGDEVFDQNPISQGKFKISKHKKFDKEKALKSKLTDDQIKEFTSNFKKFMDKVLNKDVIKKVDVFSIKDSYNRVKDIINNPISSYNIFDEMIDDKDEKLSIEDIVKMSKNVSLKRMNELNIAEEHKEKLLKEVTSQYLVSTKVTGNPYYKYIEKIVEFKNSLKKSMDLMNFIATDIGMQSHYNLEDLVKSNSFVAEKKEELKDKGLISLLNDITSNMDKLTEEEKIMLDRARKYSAKSSILSAYLNIINSVNSVMSLNKDDIEQYVNLDDMFYDKLIRDKGIPNVFGNNEESRKQLFLYKLSFILAFTKMNDETFNEIDQLFEEQINKYSEKFKMSDIIIQ